MPAKVRKAVFPAAGLGTRFLPATKAQPKEMLPIVDKPIIQYGVEEALHSGIQNIIIVTGRGKSAIEDHFDVSFELEYLLESRSKKELLAIVRGISDMINVSYIRQKEALGLGHAVLRAQELVGDEPFAVVLADDLIDAETPCLRQLLDVYTFFNAPVLAVMEVPNDKISAYGVIDAEPVSHNGSSERVYRIRDLVEKPSAADAPSNLAIIGRYVLTPEIFGCVQAIDAGAGSEIQLTDALRSQLRSRPLYACRFEGTRRDLSNELGFLKATSSMPSRRHDFGRRSRVFEGPETVSAGPHADLLLRVATGRSLPQGKPFPQKCRRTRSAYPRSTGRHRAGNADFSLSCHEWRQRVRLLNPCTHHPSPQGSNRGSEVRRKNAVLPHTSSRRNIASRRRKANRL